MTSKDHEHEHDCDCDHDDEDEIDVVYLVDEDGEETAWGMLGLVADGDREYAILSPYEQMMDEANDTLEVIVLRYHAGDDGGESFAEIEDDEERAHAGSLASAYLEGNGLEPSASEE